MDPLSTLLGEAQDRISCAQTTAELTAIESEYLGNKGALQLQLRSIGQLPQSERPAFGARVNEAKALVTEWVGTRQAALQMQETQARLVGERLDMSLPARALPGGGIHPLTSTTQQLKSVLIGLGFEFVDGPELEEYAYNFDALNYPEDHPAFDEQMTFYIDDTHLLRTQTTALQGRVMGSRKPPFRIATTGKCFRYEAVDATHHHTFHQVDVFMVDRGISMADLKGTLKQFAATMFGGDVEVRFRPDYFPFVEPGVDYSVYWGGRWLELGGAGLIHPNILEAQGIDSEVWSGFAFGLGVERIHMVRNGVKDLRQYLDNDLRFLGRYGGL